jgi:tRNA(Arg) A34 adenosine deaminase TadA
MDVSAELPLPDEGERDRYWMARALDCARRAEAEGEVPVGAVVVLGGEIVGSGWNRNIGAHDPSAHAEIVAMREAGRRLGNHRLLGAELYATLEPCAMCAGAIVHARIARVIYAAADPKTGAAGSVFDILLDERHNHRVALTPGVLREEAAELLTGFFRTRRSAERCSQGSA